MTAVVTNIFLKLHKQKKKKTESQKTGKFFKLLNLKLLEQPK